MKTKVIFKKFDSNEVIALFPDEIADPKGNISSYMRIGQHGASSPELIKDLKNATPKEYFSLKRELESIGYVLKVSAK